jgi:predicted Rossmann fold nucleotide-binding protein DprA/Smf involved in DNA uptake
MNIIQIYQDDQHYPLSLKKHLSKNALNTLTLIGNSDILQNKTLAVFSSVKCPGSIILKTYDLMRQFKDKDITVISGFHSPMEKECLNILLKGKQPIIICPARSIEGMRIKTEYKKPLEDGRLLILSPFTKKDNRVSSERAMERNRFVAAIADRIFIAYAEAEGKTEQFCREVLAWDKPIFTFDSDANKNLYMLGLKPISEAGAAALLAL